MYSTAIHKTIHAGTQCTTQARTLRLLHTLLLDNLKLIRSIVLIAFTWAEALFPRRNSALKAIEVRAAAIFPFGTEQRGLQTRSFHVMSPNRHGLP